MTTPDAETQHADVLKSLRAIAAEISALKRAGVDIDEGQFLAILDLIESGLQQVLSKLDKDPENP